MAKMLATMYGIAEEEGSIEKMMKVFDKIKEVGYEEQTVVNDSTNSLVPLIASPANANQLTDGDKTIDLPDYTKAVEDAAEKVEKDLDEMKDELDYPKSYVAPEKEDEEAEA